MSPVAQTLLQLVRRFVDNNISYEEFEKQFRNVLLGVPDKGLSEAQEILFGDALERIDLTSHEPTKEERGYGWGTPNELREWLSSNLLGSEPKGRCT